LGIDGKYRGDKQRYEDELEGERQTHNVSLRVDEHTPPEAIPRSEECRHYFSRVARQKLGRTAMTYGRVFPKGFSYL
jgi:predicted anti-sigma-YlaC factor YlaD